MAIGRHRQHFWAASLPGVRSSQPGAELWDHVMARLSSVLIKNKPACGSRRGGPVWPGSALFIPVLLFFPISPVLMDNEKAPLVPCCGWAGACWRQIMPDEALVTKRKSCPEVILKLGEK